MLISCNIDIMNDVDFIIISDGNPQKIHLCAENISGTIILF